MKVLLYDGSFYGLLTAIYHGFYMKEKDIKLYIKDTYKPNFLNMEFYINTEETKALKVYNSINDKLGKKILTNVYYLHLADGDEIPTLIFKYLKLAFKYGAEISLAKNNDIIIDVDKYRRRVSREAHRFTGFVRFKAIGENHYYSMISPDHNILPLIINHFVNRFRNQNFIIHDTKRELAIIYNMSQGIITDFSKEQGNYFFHNSFDKNYENLWKTFYSSVNIVERNNPRLQKSYMPSRYFKNLTELD